MTFAPFLCYPAVQLASLRCVLDALDHVMADTNSLRIAWDYPLPEKDLRALREALAHHQLLLYGDAASAQSTTEKAISFQVEEADVIYGQPETDLLFSGPNLRWVELSSAGYTLYDGDELRKISASATSR